MALTIIDHTDPRWEARYNRHRRENGAATYSRELVVHQAPQWEESGDRVTVSTCPLLHQVEHLPGGDLAVQYLHTYQYRTPLDQARNVLARTSLSYDRTVFVVAYQPLRDRLVAEGYEALFVPMTIDTQRVYALGRTGDGPLRPREEVAYYGNVTGVKMGLYHALRRELGRSGFELIHVSGPQNEVFPELARFRFGVGVGRCALEMLALGIRVMVAGEKFGGLFTTPGEFEVQRSVNINGRITTYDRDPVACISAWDRAFVPDPAEYDARSISIQHRHRVLSPLPNQP